MMHFVLIITTLFLSTDLVLGQDVIENIGFGQPTDSAKEGESDMVRIRLEPEGISESVAGQIIPLSLAQYRSYDFVTQRTVPSSVSNAINAIVDPAEYNDINKDFNNTVINFTLSPGEERFDIDMMSIINTDGINEGEEQFILVLEYSSAAELELDEDGGVLVVTILDDNPLYIVYSATSYTFSESDGTVESVIKVQKHSMSPPTEVDIPVIITTIDGMGTATAGEGGDYELQNYVQAKVIHINETEVELDPIMINEDDFPEGNETFFLSLMKGEKTETLNIFPSTSPATVVIQDNDEVEIGIELAEYSVMEGVMEFVEVCITVAEGQNLSHGYGRAVINISTTTGTATDHDYVSSPSPNQLIIMRGQERMCSNITITDDNFVETSEELMVILETESTTFSAGVQFFMNNATIKISDNDGAVVGFAHTNYTGDEGAYVDVCVLVHSLDQMTLNMSEFEGQYAISGLGMDANATTTALLLTARDPMQCINVSLTSDGLVEETETVILTLTQTDNVTSFGSVTPSITVITIIDKDAAILGFNQSSYTVAEEAGNSTIDVCVHLMSGIIAPGIHVNYSIEFNVANVTQDVIMDTDDGVITAENSMVCHLLTIVDNDIAEPDGEVVITINQSSLYPPTTLISRSTTTINILNDDGLVVMLEALSTTVTEGGSVTFNVGYTGVLHLQSSLYVTVTAPSRSATANADYVLENKLVIELSDSNREMNFTVLTIDDITLEDYEETFSVNISLDNPPVLANIEDDQSYVDITILDNEGIIVSFEESQYEVSEDFEQIHMVGVQIENFTMVEIPAHASITVSVGLENMTTNATEDLDYSMLQQEVVFYSNSGEAGLNVSIQGDSLVEGNEVISISISNIVINDLSNERAASVGTNGSTVLIIIDEDEANIGFLNTSVLTPEKPIILRVGLLNGTLQEGLNIHYTISTTNITADGSDYIALNEMGQINASSTTYCHNFTVVDDDLVEPQEVVNAYLVSEYNIATVIFSPNTSIITIDDKDTVYFGFEMAKYSIEEGATEPLIVRIVRENNLSPTQSFNISIQLSAESTAAEGEDFNTAMTGMIMLSPQEMYKEIEINIVHDNVGEGDEVILLDLLTDIIGNDINVKSQQNSTEVNIIEDDDVFLSFTYNETLIEGQAFDFCVGIFFNGSSLLPNGFVELRVSVNPESATGSDYSAGSFPSTTILNETSSKTCYSITTYDDSFVERDEDFRLIYEILDRHGHFTPMPGGNNVTVAIRDNDKFQLGFEDPTYRVNETQGSIDIYIVKLNDDILQTTYTFTVNASFSEWLYPADMNDFSIEPNTVEFISNETRVPITITAFNDTLEEGDENVTLQLLYDQAQNIGTVDIVRESAAVSIEDDDVVVIGFEKSAYIVVEGEELQMCVSVQRRSLTNDEPREFTVETKQLVDFGATGGGIDYDDIMQVAKNISRKTVTRQCFALSTTDDDVYEEPERFQILGSAVSSRFLQFHPDSAVIWIIDDESLLVPYPPVEDSNCSSSEKQDGRLEIVCTPPLEDCPVEFFCSEDCGPLEKCTALLKSGNSYFFEINLHNYGQENHSIEIVGFTQKLIVFRDIVKFEGQRDLSDRFDLQCVHVETEAGIIAVTCSTEDVLTSFMCSIDNKTPENCALRFEIDPESYSGGSHTFTITATNQNGESDQYSFTFDSQEISVFEAFLMERSSIAVITVVAVTIAIFILLILTICLLVCYHRRVNKYRGHESERKHRKDRDLFYSEANPVAKEYELKEQSLNSESSKSSSSSPEEDIDLPHEAYVTTPAPKESDQVLNQEPFDSAILLPQSEEFLMASFSEVIPITTEPTLTLHDLSQAYGPGTWMDTQLQRSSADSELTVRSENPASHSSSHTQTSSELPDNPANSSSPPSFPTQHREPTQHVVDPAHSYLPTPLQANVEVLAEPKQEDKQHLLANTTVKEELSLKIGRQDNKKGTVVAIHEPDSEPATSPPPPHSSSVDLAKPATSPAPPHSSSVDLAKVTVLSTASIEVSVKQKEDKKPVLKSDTEVKATRIKTEKRNDNKGKHEKFERSATDRPKRPGANNETSNDGFNKLSYWKEKEEMHQQERAKQWKSRQDTSHL